MKETSMKKSVIALALSTSITNINANTALPPSMPELMLATNYQSQSTINDYWISEKLDGVRARWDGEKLITRGGIILNPPKWFTADFPNHSLDGELWAGKGQFDFVSAVIRTKRATNKQWESIRFMVFDLPDCLCQFDERLDKLRSLIQSSSESQINSDSELNSNSELNLGPESNSEQESKPRQKSTIKLIPQFKVKSEPELYQHLKSVTAQGGEGLMLHHAQSFYQFKRSVDLQKLKPYQDREATVLEHLPGKGRLTKLMGALLVEVEPGVKFKIGTGFSDLERLNPPPIGSKITFRYQGVTRNGIPRFATFLRVYEEL